MIKEFIAVFIGGGLGSLVRFELGRRITHFSNSYFPWSTFLINILACFILGLIIGFADYKQWLSPTAKLFWTIGFCGGFSTFSAFSNDILHLFRQGYNTTLILYIILSILCCVTATFVGLLIAGKI